MSDIYKCDRCNKPESEVGSLACGRTPKGRDWQLCSGCLKELREEGITKPSHLDDWYPGRMVSDPFALQKRKTEPDIAHKSREAFAKEQEKQDMIEKSLMRVITAWKITKAFFKKFGLWAILALIIWLSPSWLAFFIPALKPFAAKWLALVISPVMPSWAAVPALAALLSLLYHGTLWLIAKIKDWAYKFYVGFKVVLLYYREEIEMILAKGEEMKATKDKAKAAFDQQVRQDRIKLITQHWEPTLEEAEGGAEREPIQKV